jgi:hypothetical protein
MTIDTRIPPASAGLSAKGISIEGLVSFKFSKVAYLSAQDVETDFFSVQQLESFRLFEL